MRLFLFFVFFFCQSVTVAQDLHSILKPSLINDEFYSETFTLFADMDNGQYLYGQIGISNIGPGDQNGFCRVMIYRPGQITINKSAIFKRSQWQYKNKPVQSLTVGLCSLTIDKQNRLTFFGDVENTTLHINLEASLETINTTNINKPDSAFTRVNNTQQGKDFYSSEILIPWSPAKAAAHKTNSKVNLKSGFGYVDHSISTFLPSELASKWIRFRAINEKDSTLLIARYPILSGSPEGWLWNQNEIPAQILKISSNLNKLSTLTNSTSFSHSPSLPQIEIEASDNKYAIKAEQLIYRQAPLEEKGLLGKMLSQFIGNPVTYSYRASIMVNSEDTIKGILEVSTFNE